MNPVIYIENGVPRHPLYRMNEPVNFVLNEEEHVAIVGPNGSGKSLLIDILMGKWPLLMNEVHYHFSDSESPMVCDNIKYIAFRDTFGDNDTSGYYQQRWNSQDMEITPLVSELLPVVEDNAYTKLIKDLFQVDEMLDKRIVLLSSGEMRKFQLARTLLTHPKVLIIDNPFIGLDQETREQLKHLLKQLTGTLSLQVILVLSKSEDIPSFITHVVPVCNRCCGEKVAVKEYFGHEEVDEDDSLDMVVQNRLKDMREPLQTSEAEEVVRLDDVTVGYGERIILNHLDWVVKRGEKWALTGANGAGKSTLLSLLCADNPQSYACSISLFGRKRGSGESIWEIKKRIGYVSPEMHRYYQKNLPAVEIVASGLNDTVGLYKRPKPDEVERCVNWMEVFGIADLKDRSYLQLSSGEQRLVLLARAFVKDPELLILDEPLHGLDERNSKRVKKVIELFCGRSNKTLIMVSHYQEDFPSCIDHALHLTKH